MPLDIPAVRGILPRGGTILGSSRTNPFTIEDGVQRITENLQSHGVDALIAIGGEDTLGVADPARRARACNVVGVPKTIDNDLSGTDYTFGFDTAVNIAIEAIDRLHTTAESPPPGADRRGDGPARRLDRAALRHGGRGQRHPHPRACRSTSTRCAAASRPASGCSYAPIIVVVRGRQAQGGRRQTLVKGETRTRSATSGSAASASGWRRRSRRAPARRPAPRCSGTSSAAARPTAFDRWLATRFGLHAIDAVATGDLGQDGGAARHRHRHACRWRRRPRSSRSSTRRSTPRPRSSSADARRPMAEPVACVAGASDWSRSAVRRVAQTMPCRVAVCTICGAPADLELVAQVAHVELHGRLGDHQPVADLAVAHAHREQLEHLVLALGEHRRPRPSGAAAGRRAMCPAGAGPAVEDALAAQQGLHGARAMSAVSAVLRRKPCTPRRIARSMTSRSRSR